MGYLVAPETVFRRVNLVAALPGTCVDEIFVSRLKFILFIKVGAVELTRYALTISFALLFFGLIYLLSMLIFGHGHQIPRLADLDHFFHVSIELWSTSFNNKD